MTALLIGTGNEELALSIGFPEISPAETDFVLWSLDISLTMPQCFPQIQQSVTTNFYQMLKVDALTELVNGDTKKRFVIDELNFRMDIFEHTLNDGPRYGFIVDVNIRTPGLSYAQEWPGDVPNQILHDHRKGAASQNFAFAVDQEHLQSFHRDLKIDIQRYAKNGG